MFFKFLFPKIVWHIFSDILYFPIWWYSFGLYAAWMRYIASVQSMNRSLGFTIWLKNIFTPMFQQRDISGRIISFFMRSLQIVFRGLFMIVFVCLWFIVFLVYPILPIIIVWQIYKTW